MDDFEYDQRRNRRNRTPIYMTLSVVFLALGLFGGYQISKWFAPASTDIRPGLYEEIAVILDNFFLDLNDKTQLSVKERMAIGMVAALGDPYSSYMSVSESEDLGETINGNFYGIGINFTTTDLGGIILDVYQDTPAKKAGLRSGDIITHIEGTSIQGYKSDKIKNMIQGEEGEELSLTILRNGKEQDIEVTRGSVETSVYYEFRQKNNVDFGYLRITTFGETTIDDVENALELFKKMGVEDIVIDLRDNGGGYLVTAREILDLFIPEGKVMYTIEPHKGKKEIQKATDHPKYTFERGYLLVNENTASASEVLSAALKDHLNYQIIGEATYGKGIAQTQKTLSNSSVLKYTYAKWLTPKGKCIQGEGIQPDYEVKKKTLDDFDIVKMEKSYQYDDVDEIVLEMQKNFFELGYKIDRQDGYFSKSTEETLKTFEKDYGLKVDGIYDHEDATILLSALTYHLYQDSEDLQYQKALELM